MKKLLIALAVGGLLPLLGCGKEDRPKTASRTEIKADLKEYEQAAQDYFAPIPAGGVLVKQRREVARHFISATETVLTKYKNSDSTWELTEKIHAMASKELIFLESRPDDEIFTQETEKQLWNATETQISVPPTPPSPPAIAPAPAVELPSANQNIAPESTPPLEDSVLFVVTREEYLTELKKLKDPSFEKLNGSQKMEIYQKVIRTGSDLLTMDSKKPRLKNRAAVEARVRQTQKLLHVNPSATPLT